MKVELLGYTCPVNPEKSTEQFVGACAKGCYSEFPSYGIIDTLSQEQAEKTLNHIVKSGHGSVIEHLVFSFSVEGISRACSHQLVRHRIASYSQQSQRYVCFEEVGYVIPKSVQNALYRNPKLREIASRYDESMRELSVSLRAEGVPEEDIRYFYPNGSKTNITITMNARSLLNFFTWRCCNQAQDEIRELANSMLSICKKVSPVIFANAGPECVRTGCKEGKRSCGNPPIKRIE